MNDVVTGPAKPKLNWVVTLMFIGTTVVSLTAVPLYGYYYGYDAFEWGVFLFFMIATGTAITGGYHRLWSHNAYQAHWLVQFWYAFFGAAAVQNSALEWCSKHRYHHRHVDVNEKDPYSINKGFWFAHMGWMIRDYPTTEADYSNARDLERNPIIAHQHRHYGYWVLASTVALPILIGFLHGDVFGTALLAGFLRLFLTHQFTFFINSLAHIWGKRPYTDTNSARDNGVLALLTYGEGYHNYHHFFQNDYRNGVRWWQFDPTKWLINALAWVGLANNLRRVPKVKIREALVNMRLKRLDQKLDGEAHPHPKWENLQALIQKEKEQFSRYVDEVRQAVAQSAIVKRAIQEGQKLEKQVHHSNQQLIKTLETALKAQYKRLEALNRQVVAVAA